MVDFFPSLFSLHGYVSIGLKYIYIYILQIYRFIKSRVFFIVKQLSGFRISLTRNCYGAPEFTPVFLWGLCYSIFSFLCSFLYITACSFVLFLLAIMLSILLQFTDSDYPFDIFNLFLHH